MELVATTPFASAAHPFSRRSLSRLHYLVDPHGPLARSTVQSVEIGSLAPHALIDLDVFDRADAFRSAFALQHFLDGPGRCTSAGDVLWAISFYDGPPRLCVGLSGSSVPAGRCAVHLTVLADEVAIAPPTVRALVAAAASDDVV